MTSGSRSGAAGFGERVAWPCKRLHLASHVSRAARRFTMRQPRSVGAHDARTSSAPSSEMTIGACSER
ncbi:Hypothetical protein A7982_01943 [Minicystis rosea]|nr:Hypothetical protein A7982_01943 [Minicystis rosea]